MSRSLAVKGFTATFAAVYIAGFIFNETPFKYYPLIKTWSLQTLGHDAGPGMNYYGWITQGVVAAIVVALIALAVPARWADRVWSGFAWFAPAVIMALTLVFEVHWFTDG